MVKKILYICFSVGLLFLSYCLYTVWELNPQIQGQLYHSGISSRVEIIRSHEGVPSISAENDEDAYFAQGYVHAQDRLFQMVFLKHFISGRVSELVGTKAVSLDRYMRTFALARAAKSSYEVLDSRTQNAIVSYTQGVNAYIQNHTCLELKLLGVQPDLWEPSDSVLIQKAIAFDLSKHWPQIMRNTVAASKLGIDKGLSFVPDAMLSEPSVHDVDLINHKLPYRNEVFDYPDGPEIPASLVSDLTSFGRLSHAILSNLAGSDDMSEGSNIWAISKERSTKGSVLLANDPHLSYQVPSTFYPISLKSDHLDLQGASIPGAPGVVIGRNANVAWGFTNSRLAQSDIFYAPQIEEKITREEIIRIKDAEDVVIHYQDTPYGTIISDSEAELEVALKWVGQTASDHTLDALHALSTSRSFEEAKQAAKLFDSPAQNIVIVDDKNYGFFTLGKIPIRKYSGRIALPAEPEYQWQGYIPKNQLPFAINPERGYVMNANNHVVSDHYGYNLTKLGYDEYRGIKINEDLRGRHKVSPSMSKRLQLNNEDQSWVELKPVLLDFEPKSEQAKELLQKLDKWSGVADLESFEQTIFAAWHAKLSKKVFANVNIAMPHWAKVAYDDQFLKLVIFEGLPYFQPHASIDELLEKTLLESYQSLVQRYGENPERFTWKNVHRAAFLHPIFKNVPVLSGLSESFVVAPGSKDSLNRSKWRGGETQFFAKEGASLRVLVDMSTPLMRMMVPMGVSGFVFSAYYANLNELWASGEYLVLPGKEENIKIDKGLTILPNLLI
jgi:penicillin amidase